METHQVPRTYKDFFTAYGEISLWRRANAQNVSFSYSLRWQVHIISSVDKIK